MVEFLRRKLDMPLTILPKYMFPMFITFLTFCISGTCHLQNIYRTTHNVQFTEKTPYYLHGIWIFLFVPIPSASAESCQCTGLSPPLCRWSQVIIIRCISQADICSTEISVTASSIRLYMLTLSSKQGEQKEIVNLVRWQDRHCK